MASNYRVRSNNPHNRKGYNYGGLKKTRLTEGIDFDDRIFEEPDNEEEILLQNAMEELMIEDNTESITEDLEAESIVLVPVEGQKDQKQKTKQKQITDFFQSQK